MPTYAQLQARHPSWDGTTHAQLTALYEGGRSLEKLYPLVLKKRPRERQERWELRVTEAEYRNYLGPIIDYFKSMLFVSRPVLKAKREGKDEAEVDPGEYWTTLREDCDRGGTDIDALFGQVLTDAMVGRTGWIRVHAPTAGEQAPTDAAEFETRKLGDCWLERIDPCEVLDWDLGEDGRLLWAVTHKQETPRQGLDGDRSTIVETWEYLTRDAVETYQLKHNAKDGAPKPDEAVAKIGSAPHSFGAVPLVCLDLPHALWVGNRLKSAQLAHFRKVCAQSWSLATTAYAMPVAKVEDPTEYAKQVAGAGYEIVIGKDEDYTWEAPPTGHFSSLDTEIKACKDELFRAANQMALGVENNAAAVGRSAESKASDAESTRVVLVAFSRRVKECIEYTLDLIARQRGEQFDWSVEGLDDFAALDLNAFLEQLKLVKDTGGIPSRTFEIQSKTRTAEAILKDLDEATKQKMRQEIEDGAVDPVEEREREQEAALELFADPSGAERPGKDPEKPAKKPPGKQPGKQPGFGAKA